MIRVLTTVYNCETWIEKCIKSIQDQKEKDFKCYLLNDMSTDDSVKKAEEAIEGDDRFVIINNTKKYYQGGNYDQIMRSDEVHDEDVVIEVDGDDWLPDDEVFTRVLKAYEDDEVWLAYGQFQYDDGRPGFAALMNPATCRRDLFTITHIRTWKAFLWRKIFQEDLYYADGWYAKSGGDTYFMIPMFEMAGLQHSKFMPEVNYIYNDDNPLNDNKKSLSDQEECARYAKSKRPYPPLNFAYAYLTNSRFDIIPKYLYAMYRELGIKCTYGEDLYKEHLRVWNNFKELDKPDKNTYEKFKDEFDNILDSMKNKGFNKEFPVVISRRGNLLNGGHRTAAALLYNSSLKTKVGSDTQGQENCGSAYFKSLGLGEGWCDSIALEYAKLKPRARLVTIFPSCGEVDQSDEKIHAALEILQEKTNIYYAKELSLNKNGFENYMRQVYLGESWLGNPSNGFAGAKEKAQFCGGTGKMIALLIEPSSSVDMVKVKDEVRDLFGLGNHSIHINDTYEETLRLARVIYNRNSLHFLEHGQPDKYEKLTGLLSIYEKTLRMAGITPDLFSITGSAVLSMYGLRECEDLDYLHFHKNHVLTGHELINSHETELNKYPMHKHEILFNPNNHFYWNNVKFASLTAVTEMKAFRGEEKDERDLTLMESVGGNA